MPNRITWNPDEPLIGRTGTVGGVALFSIIHRPERQAWYAESIIGDFESPDRDFPTEQEAQAACERSLVILVRKLGAVFTDEQQPNRKAGGGRPSTTAARKFSSEI